MEQSPKSPHKLAPFLRAIIEIAFIIFLFYSNLLMCEFTRGHGQGKTLWMAMHDVVTAKNLIIAMVAASMGHAVFEFLRRRV